jgi:hypothetical protein
VSNPFLAIRARSSAVPRDRDPVQVKLSGTSRRSASRESKPHAGEQYRLEPARDLCGGFHRPAMAETPPSENLAIARGHRTVSTEGSCGAVINHRGNTCRVLRRATCWWWPCRSAGVHPIDTGACAGCSPRPCGIRAPAPNMRHKTRSGGHTASRCSTRTGSPGNRRLPRSLLAHSAVDRRSHRRRHTFLPRRSPNPSRSRSCRGSRGGAIIVEKASRLSCRAGIV